MTFLELLLRIITTMTKEFMLIKKIVVTIVAMVLVKAMAISLLVIKDAAKTTFYLVHYVGQRGLSTLFNSELTSSISDLQKGRLKNRYTKCNVSGLIIFPFLVLNFCFFFLILIFHF